VLLATSPVWPAVLARLVCGICRWSVPHSESRDALRSVSHTDSGAPPTLELGAGMGGECVILHLLSADASCVHAVCPLCS